MKKIRIVSSLILGIVFSSYGQTNKIDNTGNVGIGTTTPAEKLEVRGNINSEKFQIRTPSSGSWFNITSPNGSNRFDINRRYNGDIPLMSVLTSGNVGIGTTTPNTVLHIKKNQSGWLQEIAGTASNNGDFVGLKVLSGYAGETNKWIGISAIAENLHSNATGLGLYTGATERFRIQHNGNVGIGTTNPDAKLRIQGTYSLGRFYTDTDGRFEIQVTRSNSTALNTDLVLSAQQHIVLDPNTNGTSGNVGIGTYAPDAKLAVNGTIHSKEVKVDLVGWPDYVFENDYNLPTLQQVENHITEKGHLENIPSTAEVLENGIQLGEMNSKLLQKIEELTLYMIEQHKKTENQQKEIYKLQEENKQLQSINSMLIELQMRLEKLESKTK
ncbi:hypothetical protein [uncultured Aquimarina sp.]|uniref:hypothetical protein n=1 Tax=uncultured Aquimarina sp. TaxID=575652 RepID=UPI002631F008|nr:hypothetical protein [uncultured Aquimarina sp.]